VHQSESDALTKDRNDERLRNVTGRPDDWRYSLIIPHQTIGLAKTNGDHTSQKGLVMTMTATKLALECHLHFNGNAKAAFDSYQKIFGGELSIFTFGDSPMRDRFPDQADKVLHARLQTGDAALIGCDVPENYETPRGFDISIQLADEGEAERIFNALADGGQIGMPLQETFWSPRFGMLADRYGIAWMVNIVLDGGDRSEVLEAHHS
jgi:PhnB protein